MSARKIPKNYRNVTGIAASNKADGQAGFESTLERDFLTLIEFSQEVEAYKVQPVGIRWADHANKKRCYFPDVLVYYTEECGRSPFLFEVKYRSDLATNWNDYKPKFKAALSFARLKDWRFKLITEVEIRTPLLKNARFLLPFRIQQSNSPEYLEMLTTKLRQLGKTSPSQLIATIYDEEWSQAKLLPSLWFLVASFQVGCDLAKPLNMESELWWR
nr:heteromeric transposase endonuclease subunit TnsA [uncultured Pseudodesulfovibrio sp.]